jgi:HlyD family secretion protein
VSDEQLEQLKTQVEVNRALVEAAEFGVQQAEAQLRDARWSLSRTTIVAPMSGKVTRLNVELGETAIQGTLNKDAATLMTISDLGVLETKIKVDETDVSRISVGDSAVIEIDAFPDTTFVGKVVRISNSSIKAAGAAQAATDQAVDYEVTIQLLDAPPSTRPDFTATAKVVTDVRARALSIPIIALTVREDSAAMNADTAGAPSSGAPKREVGKRDIEGVFVVNADNTVSFKSVKVGIAGDRYFEVLGGLKTGDRIVAGTYQAIRELKEGSKIKEQMADSASKGRKEGKA